MKAFLKICLHCLNIICVYTCNPHNTTRKLTCDEDQPKYFFDECGDITGKTIWGGNETKPNKYPWQVLIVHDRIDGKMEFCGGSIISDTKILTAAHCVYGKPIDQIVILIGNHNWQLAPVTGAHERDEYRHISKIDIFPRYKEMADKNFEAC